MSALTERLGRQAVAIYLAAESSVADDIADGLRQAVAEIARLKAEVERLTMALRMIANGTCIQHAMGPASFAHEILIDPTFAPTTDRREK